MESFFTRYRNPMMLAGVLLLQLIGLAAQVKRPLDPSHPDIGSVRLLRLWIAGIVTPFENGLSAVSHGVREGWHDYVNVVGLRHENENLRAENEQLRLEQVRMAEESAQAHRLQALLEFKEHFGTQTVAAQVIGSSGTEQSRVLYIDKGWHDGVRPDMAVITPEGVVGKVRDVFRSSAQVLLISDAMSGVGALLVKSRLFGVAKGTSPGLLMLDHIMSDEKVEKGDSVVTSGGDRIFPKGLPVGTVEDVSSGSDLFLNIRIRPAAQLNRLEEVLVITDVNASQEESASEQPIRAADILAQRLPTAEKKTETKQPVNTVVSEQEGTTTKLKSAAAATSVARGKVANAPDTEEVKKVAIKPKPAAAASPKSAPPATDNSVKITPAPTPVPQDSAAPQSQQPENPQ